MQSRCSPNLRVVSISSVWRTFSSQSLYKPSHVVRQVSVTVSVFLGRASTDGVAANSAINTTRHPVNEISFDERQDSILLSLAF